MARCELKRLDFIRKKRLEVLNFQFFSLSLPPSMKSSLSARLTYRIMAVVLAMMAVIAGLVYFKVRDSMLLEAQARYLNVLRKIQGDSRRVTTLVEMVTLNNAHDIEGDLDYPEKIFDHVERIVNLSDNISCCYLVFEPYHYPSEGRLFIPCARRDASGSVRVLQIDSTYHSYFTDVWFQEQVKTDTCNWTKPYFESQLFAGDDKPRLLKTFTVPIHNSEGRPVALLCSDLSLESMQQGVLKEMERAHQQYEEGCSQHSYNFSFSYHGVYVSHPDVQRIVNRNFVEDVKATPDTLDDFVLKSMMNNQEGSAMVNIDGVPSWIYYQNIKQRRLISVIVVPEEVIFHNGRRLNAIILAVMLAGLLAIYFICRRQIKGIADPVAMQKANLEHELKIANGIQMAMLPKAFDECANIDLYASLTPARDVGGDLYDYFLHLGRLFFCIGDVSGKGVPAALMMAVVRSMFRSEARRADSAAAIVDTLNHNMDEESSAGYFVTMFVGILDINTGMLDYCNAGHETPILAGHALPVKLNLPVGALSYWNYEGQQVQLQSGDVLFLYTDGLSEAKNTAREQLGRKYVLQIAGEHCTDTAQQLVERMEDEKNRHTGNAEQSDDIAMLAIRWQLPESLTIAAFMDDIAHLKPFVADAAKRAGMGDEDAKKLRLAAEEAVANVINHGQATTITLQATVVENLLQLTIEDDGQPFDPTADSTTDFSIPPDQRTPGGLGIMLLHEMSDGLSYQRANGHNILTIRKTINLKQ